MKKFSILFILLFVIIKIYSQEFICNVQVNSHRLEGTDKRVFESLQTALNEFINSKNWTNYPFQLEERIECSILITVDERSSVDEFKGKMNIALHRPVYNTSYNSVLFNYVEDNFRFRHIEFQSIDFTTTTYTSNLTSTLAYYLYLFLGLDFDSFSLYGGTPFYEKAQEVVNAAQSSPYSGWKPYESQKNKYWLVENLLNPSYRDLRKFMYEYHRKGLDALSKNTVEARANITKNLELLQKLYNERPNLFALQLFIQAKRDEFINLYSEGSTIEKNNAIKILSQIDPANSSKYQKILKKR
jgi:hypothetical protein